MTSKSTAELSWERLFRELALIEGIALHAISPPKVYPPEAPAKTTSRRKKNAPVAGGPPGADERAYDTKRTGRADDESTEIEREEKLFKAQIAEIESSIGTTIVPSSRDELIHAFEILRPAFDAIIELFKDRQRGVVYDDRSKIYDSLHDLMQAAFRIGAQATISTRAQGFVQRKVRTDSANSARKIRGNNDNAIRRAQLDDAILQVSARSLNDKLASSYEFAGLIIKQGSDLLGVNHKGKPHSQHTIKRHITKLLKARNSRTTQTE